MRGIPLVLEVRDLWPDYMVQLGMLKSRPLRAGLFALEQQLLRKADHVVVVTESFRKRVVAKGVRPDRVDIIPNGVDVTDYHASREQPPFAALNKAAGEFIVGYLGTFGKGQGLEYVMRAAGLVGKKESRIRFVLAGDGPELPRAKQEIEKLRLTNVALHPPIPREQTRAFYNACDVCLVPLAPVPIFSETIPSKIFEIMACERPLIASVAGEGAAIVERSGGGVRTEPGDAEGLASAILSVRAMNAGDREAMGQRARRYVAAHYDRVALADKYFEILKMVAERGRNGRVELSS
jgi:glycosyltransferase involved in cell wall biosynthesis